MASEVYSVSGDTAGGTVIIDVLREEILADPVVPPSDAILVREDVLTIEFPVVLSPIERAALDGVVGLHPTTPEKDEVDGTASWQLNRNPTPSDDETQAVQLGDLWVNTVTEDKFICVSNLAGVAEWDELGEGGGGNFDDLLWVSSGELVYIVRPPSRSEVLTV